MHCPAFLITSLALNSLLFSRTLLVPIHHPLLARHTLSPTLLFPSSKKQDLGVLVWRELCLESRAAEPTGSLRGPTTSLPGGSVDGSLMKWAMKNRVLTEHSQRRPFIKLGCEGHNPKQTLRPSYQEDVKSVSFSDII